MAFSSIKFMGINVRNISATMGWDGQTSEVKIGLVEDTAGGDSFINTPNGTPATLVVGNMTFRGLVQRYVKNKSSQGEVYEVILHDPRTILAGTQVITGGYSGSVSSRKNIINAFGYWENFGFGSSLTNEGGMPWYKVLAAINVLVNGGTQTSFGGPLYYRGFEYSIDLTQLPLPSANYRVPSGVNNLLDLITSICEDGGHNFFVELDNYTIRIKTVSRITAPIMGTITALIEAAEGDNLVRSSSGIETRNESTSIFLTGGEVKDLIVTDGISSFWGFDVNGDPILGTRGVFAIVNPFGNLIGYEASDFMDLNAVPITDVIGTLSYSCSEMEMRCAQASFDTWASFIHTYKPSLQTALGIPNTLVPPQNNGFGNTWFGGFIENAQPANAGALAQTDINELKYMRLYEFVRSYANNYMGKKFAISTPQISKKIDPETQVVTYSYEPTDGGYLPEGSQPLGLLAINEDKFTLQDGRFTSFVRFDNVTYPVDLSRIDKSSSIFQLEGYSNGYPYGTLFSRASVDPQIIFTPDPAVVITLPHTVEIAPGDIAGGLPFIQAIMNGPQGQAAPVVPPEDLGFNPLNILFGVANAAVAAVADANQAVQNIAFGTTITSGALSPATLRPNYVAVPLKSNILTYGPWTASSVDGKITVQQDSTLVPWNYGGFDNLELVALAKVQNYATATEIIETGSCEFEGLPIISLGQVLQVGGPNVTNIDIKVGTDGVTTTYSFKTYTPRFGIFDKGKADQIKRLGQISQEFRKDFRTKIREATILAEQVGGGELGQELYLNSLNRAMLRRTPHTTVLGQHVQNGSSIEVGVSLTTFQEAIIGCNPHREEYKDCAVMGLEGVLRPVEFNGTNELYSQFAGDSGVFSSPLNADNLNPFKVVPSGTKKTTSSLTVGTGYHDLHTNAALTELAIASGEPQRFSVLRGPLLLTGWGYTIDGKVVPTGISETSFKDDYLSAVNKWKTGPLDLAWDDYRGVWTMPRTLKGTLDTQLSPFSGTFMTVHSEISSSPTDLKIEVKNYFNNTIASGSRAIATYDPTENIWYASIFENANGSSFSLPTGQTYSVLWYSASGTTDWSRTPTIQQLSLGNATLGNGQLNLVKSNGDVANIIAEAPAGGISYILPADSPTVGEVLKIQSVGGNVQLEWSADISGVPFGESATDVALTSSAGTANTTSRSDHIHAHPVWNDTQVNHVPTGDNYSVLHRVNNQYGFNKEPTIYGMTVGGTGVSNGYIKIGTSNASGLLGLYSEAMPTGYNIFFPGNKPIATGQLLRIKSFSGNDFILEWFGTAGSGGINGDKTYVSDVTCSGSTLTVTKRTMTFEYGRVINEY